jgi:hypothetical protein
VPGVEKVAILTENTDYGIPASQETAKGLNENGVESVIFSVDIGTQDYAGIVERIKAEDPDMIITLVTGEAAYNFTQQAADAGIGPLDLPVPVTGQDALESGAYWTNVPDGQYAFVQRIGVPESQFTEKGKAFAAAYKEKTGKSDVESYAMEAYDSIAILAQAIEEAGSTDGDAIVGAGRTSSMRARWARSTSLRHCRRTQRGRQGRRVVAPVARPGDHHDPVSGRGAVLDRGGDRLSRGLQDGRTGLRQPVTTRPAAGQPGAGPAAAPS